jgi:hypothetical protein
MTDQTLQAVLADLRPKYGRAAVSSSRSLLNPVFPRFIRLAKKFNAEQPTKKSTVEVHRGGEKQWVLTS